MGWVCCLASLSGKSGYTAPKRCQLPEFFFEKNSYDKKLNDKNTQRFHYGFAIVVVMSLYETSFPSLQSTLAILTFFLVSDK
jgi:hypothetical protein